jgi:hypothetical protein
VFFFLGNRLDEALKILEAGRDADPEGLMANCAGNLLVRAGQFEGADKYYRKALIIAPDNIEYLSNRASCLIEMGYYGEADKLLAQAHSREPSPEILELISYVAAKKGEFSRSESASLAALEMDPFYAPSLFSLGWLYSSAGRWDDMRDILERLEDLDLGGEDEKRREELRKRLEDAMSRLIVCAACGRNWRVPRESVPVPPIRLYAMPPDDIPAGSCPACGKTYCIGCAREHLDEDGRFVCPGCHRTLKLVDDGLKKIVWDWASAAIPPGAKEKNPGIKDGGGETQPVLPGTAAAPDAAVPASLETAVPEVPPQAAAGPPPVISISLAVPEAPSETPDKPEPDSI